MKRARKRFWLGSVSRLHSVPFTSSAPSSLTTRGANIKFARTIEPDNRALVAREAEVKQQLAKGEPTIPVTIGDEKLANSFLRADLSDVAAGIGMAGKPAVDVFTEIRARKNKF